MGKWDLTSTLLSRKNRENRVNRCQNRSEYLQLGFLRYYKYSWANLSNQSKKSFRTVVKSSMKDSHRNGAKRTRFMSSICRDFFTWNILIWTILSQRRWKFYFLLHFVHCALIEIHKSFHYNSKNLIRPIHSVY